MISTYSRRGEYGKEHALLVRWLGTQGSRTDSGKLADLRDKLGMTSVLRHVPRPRVTGSRSARLHSYLNVLGTRTVDLTVHGVTLPWLIDTGANLSVVSFHAFVAGGLTF